MDLKTGVSDTHRGLRLFGRRVSLAACCLLLTVASAAYALPANFTQQTVLTGVTKATSIASLPGSDSRFMVTEQKGRVKIFDTSTIPATATTILDIAGSVNSTSERGLATITLDPGFTANGYFYIYYTHKAGELRNRVSRFTFTDGATPSAGAEVLIWEDNEPVSSCCHYGGGMDFGPDGMLYLTTGDEFDVGSDPSQAQDLTRAGGKIVRLDTAGASEGGWERGGDNSHLIPADNPSFAGAPANALKEIWAYGLRNPFRAHWDLPTNRFYIGEVGGNVQSTAREDLHVGVKGGNYGWPFCEGQCADAAFEDPVYDYGHTGSTPNGGAIAAGMVYRGNAYPNSYQGAFFFADYVLGFIKYLKFNADGSVSSVNEFTTGSDTPVSMDVGADGNVYVLEYGGTTDGNGKVVRYVYNTGNQPPVIANATGTYTPGTAPLLVNFTASATDLDNSGAELTYRWFFGDGTEKSGASVQHVYADSGLYNAFVRVSDPIQSVNSEEIQIQAGVAPLVKIDFPVNNTRFRAGDTINYKGSVLNPNPAVTYEYQWDIDFLHNAHIHPGASSTLSADSFIVEPSGHDYIGSTGYILNLTVTDSIGLRTTEQVTIYPEKVDMNLSTLPAGLDVLVDGLSVSTEQSGSYSYDTLIGFEHLMSAAETVCHSGVSYEFDSWSGTSAGRQRVHSLTVPTADFNLIANYATTGATCSGGNEGGDFVLPESGLVAHFEADVGVSEVEGVVSAWADQSGQGNDLVAIGDPTIAADAVNGKPAIDFDANDDRLQKLVPSALSTGAQDRTMYLVANYRDGAWGGMAYGQAARNATFGLVTDGVGRLAVQGYAADYPTGESARGTWLVQSAVLQGNQVTHYRDGTMIDSQTQTYATGSDILMLGGEISGNPAPMNMQIAAAVIYDRALSTAEQASVQNYLQRKYFGGGGGQPGRENSVKRVVADLQAIYDFSDGSGTIVKDISGLSPALDLTITDRENVTWGQGTLTVTGATSLKSSTETRLSDSIKTSNQITVEAWVTPGNRTQAGPAQIVSLSDNATQSNVMLGQMACQVDVRMRTTESELEGMISPKRSLVTNLAHVVYTRQLDGTAILYIDGVEKSSTVIAGDLSAWTDALNLTLANKVGDDRPWLGEFNLVAVYSRALTSSEVDQNFRAGPTATVEPAQDAQVRLALNDADQSITSRKENSAAAEVQQSSTTLGQVIEPDGVATASIYSPGSAEQGSDGNNLSFPAEVVVDVGQVPESGLVARFESDTGVVFDESGLASWLDQSDQRNDLVVSGNPILVTGALNGYPVIDLDGAGDWLQKVSPAGLPVGASDRTVYLVANYRGGSKGGANYGNGLADEVFGLVTNAAGQLTVQDYIADSTALGDVRNTWLVQSVVLAENQLSHFRDGLLIDAQQHDYNTGSDMMILGADLPRLGVNPEEAKPGTSMDMQIAALLIYDRALSADEQTRVQRYLQTKYFGGVKEQAPVALADVVDVTSGASVTVRVIDNDSDLNGQLDPSTVVITANGQEGKASVNGDGSVTYQHYGQGSLDSFEYTVSDATGLRSNRARVTITVNSQSAVAQLTQGR